MIRKAQVVLALLYLFTQWFSEMHKILKLVSDGEAHQQAPLEQANSHQQWNSSYQHCYTFNKGSIDFSDNSIHYVLNWHIVIHHHRLGKKCSLRNILTKKVLYVNHSINVFTKPLEWEAFIIPRLSQGLIRPKTLVLNIRIKPQKSRQFLLSLPSRSHGTLRPYGRNPLFGSAWSAKATECFI